MNSDNNPESQFNEEDIKTLFGNEAPPAEPVKIEFKPAAPVSPPAFQPVELTYFNWLTWLLGLLKILTAFTLIFIVSFTVLNFPALWTKMRYYFQVEKGNHPWTQNQKFPPLATINNHLVIPKIGVDAPIEWNIPNEQTLDALEKGVAHYQDTALPGEIGNVFITGHSSYYLWAGGSYKQIFALLDKLEAGDRIYLNYQNKVFAYEVTGKKVVKPEDLSVLNQGNQRTLTLMTCVPVGTNLNRLVVSAKQIAL